MEIGPDRPRVPSGPAHPEIEERMEARDPFAERGSWDGRDATGEGRRRYRGRELQEDEPLVREQVGQFLVIGLEAEQGDGGLVGVAGRQGLRRRRELPRDLEGWRKGFIVGQRFLQWRLGPRSRSAAPLVRRNLGASLLRRQDQTAFGRQSPDHTSSRIFYPGPACARLLHWALWSLPATRLLELGGQFPSGTPIPHSCPNGSTIWPSRQPCSSPTGEVSVAPATALADTRLGVVHHEQRAAGCPSIERGLRRLMVDDAGATHNAASSTPSCATMSSSRRRDAGRSHRTPPAEPDDTAWAVDP
jgi:hypothetical protein